VLWFPTVLVIMVAMGFTYTNGFHDAANAVATSIATRALTPRIALLLAAVFNFIGALFGGAVARTIARGIVDAPAGSQGLALVGGALLGAIGWNLLTWWRGLPSSSAYALVGGLVGAAIAASATVNWHGVLDRVLIPMVLVPVVGFGLGFGFMTGIRWLFRRSGPGQASRGFRYAQSFSACALALGHGLQASARSAGVVVLTLDLGGHHSGNDIPPWVLVLTALVLSAGTYAGGWRIIRTLGRRIVDLDPAQGFAAETTAASILYVAGLAFEAPISTTQTTTSAVVGVGATQRLRAVRWGVVGNIAGAWILTFPGSAAVAALAYLILHLLT
jgi:inorganic phosphate transporter, PiT family